jgi:hypothetical protein
MKSPDDAYFQAWQEDPEPMKNEGDERVILDTNLSDTAWLWDMQSEKEAYLVFNGRTWAVRR